MARYEIRISGFGGQGVITLSKMIIMAGSIYENLAATQTEAYSAEARGGKCWAEIVLDLDKNITIIDYPKALSPYDFLIILSEEASKDIKKADLKEGVNTGFMIWDSSTIKKFATAGKVKSLGFPIQKIALERFGNTVYGNVILFGAFTVIANIFSEESALETIKKFVPKSTLSKNIEAFEVGKQEALEFLKNKKEAK